MIDLEDLDLLQPLCEPIRSRVETRAEQHQLVEAHQQFREQYLVEELRAGDLVGIRPGTVRSTSVRNSDRVRLCLARVVTLKPPRNWPASSSGQRTAGSSSKAPAALNAAAVSAVLRGTNGLRPRSPSAIPAPYSPVPAPRKSALPPSDATLASRPRGCVRGRALACAPGCERVLGGATHARHGRASSVGSVAASRSHPEGEATAAPRGHDTPEPSSRACVSWAPAEATAITRGAEAGSAGPLSAPAHGEGNRRVASGPPPPYEGTPG
jgi:hypothetical protein